MRGKVLERKQKADKVGITPAYAGKRSQCSSPITCLWDHPRVCGEKLEIGTECAVIKGSPPRMRGKEIGTRSPSFIVGITPAYAGKREK